MSHQNYNMEEIDALLDLPSPSNSQYYMYGDAEQYVDNSTSESQSPVNSPYDMSFVPDMNISNIYPSPVSSNGDGESAQNAGSKAPAKRKRENRYKNAPPSVLSRRRAQNRASQRAYRERKDQRIKDLEAMLNEAKQKNDVLSQAYAALHAEYIKLTSTKSDVYDPTIAVGNGERFDMDMFVYQDMSAYNL